MTESEQNIVREIAATDRRYFLYLLMLDCGCRPAEAAECMGKDIVKIDGVNLLHIRGTKTAAANRLVPIPENLYLLIKNTLKTENIAVYSHNKKIGKDSRRRIWLTFKKKCGFDDVVPYCLRHTYCTNLARKGIDIRTAQKLMGHASITMTANIYTNLDVGDIVSVAEKLR